MSTFISYLRKVLAFSVFVSAMSALPIGAIAPEYRIAYLVADEVSLSEQQPELTQQELTVVPEATPVKDNPTASMPQIPKIVVASVPTVAKPAATTTPAPSAVGGPTQTHVVKSGETLSGIANKYRLTVAQLSALNGITNPHMIRLGQKLLLVEEPPKPISHTVRSGENLSYIAANYGVTVTAIIQSNNLPDINRLKIGQVLNIPATTSGVLASRSSASSTGFIWPLIGTISSYFGERRGVSRHSGLDIAAPSGRDIKAARAGRVDSAGWMGGYGYAVIIDHGEGYKTLYAHASKLLVKAGDRVVQGQVIAKVGSTGNSTGPHVHLEVRQNSKFMDPLKYLPKR